MLIENSTRIDNLQLEMNTVDILFWIREFIKIFIKKFSHNFPKKVTKNNFKIKKEYYKKLKNMIPVIFSNFSFFHPMLLGNKPWVIFWLLNSLDIVCFNLRKKFSLKRTRRIFISLSNLNLSKICKNPTVSLFIIYSTILYSILKFNVDYNSSKIYSIKSTYYFIRSLLNKSLSARNSEISDCDSRNIYCIFNITSLFGTLTIDLETLCMRKLRQLSITSEGFSTKNFSGAHGALTYCCFGALSFLIIKKDEIKFSFNVKKWLTNRQNLFMFGLSGKISKIPDSCYNFWIGASLVIMNLKLNEKLENSFIFSNDKISNYFSDRCGKVTDFYHICYSICGFSILNFLIIYKTNSIKKNLLTDRDFFFRNLAKINPLFSIRESRVIHFVSCNK